VQMNVATHECSQTLWRAVGRGPCMKRNIREKPHRLPRHCYRGRVIVAFTACVDKRHTPFVDSEVVSDFLDSLGKAATKCKCLVPIYCFMPDHVHVILHGQDDSADAWQAMGTSRTTRCAGDL